MWPLAIIAMLASAFVLVLVTYLAGVIVPPIYNVVVNSDAVVKMGYDVGVEVAVRIGLKYVPALLALVIVFWFVFLRLRQDSYQGYNGR